MSTKEQQPKVWFVTGASSGFGREIALAAIARGDRVVATARSPESVADLVARAPDRVLAARLDVTRGAEIRASVAAALARFGRVDVLVNNAGYSMVGAVEETSDEELRAALDLMFFGAAAVTREVLPGMRARGAGVIVQISSVGGQITAPGFGPYCAAKHALEALSEALAAEVASHGVRVLIVEPGAFRTRLFGGGFRAMPEIAAYADAVGPMRKYAATSNGTQQGDPAKAARAIARAVDDPDHPLRLPLGGDAVDSIRGKLAAVARDVDTTEAAARDTGLDG